LITFFSARWLGPLLARPFADRMRECFGNSKGIVAPSPSLSVICLARLPSGLASRDYFQRRWGAFPPLRSIGWRGEERGEVSLNGTGNYPGNVLAGYFHNPKGIVCSKPAKPFRPLVTRPQLV
jgi:hypothetical protein